MINVGIYDGDILIVERRNTAHNGETVVAMNEDNEATVKTFYKEEGYYRLQPENDDMDPIIVMNCEILGKVIGVEDCTFITWACVGTSNFTAGNTQVGITCNLNSIGTTGKFNILECNGVSCTGNYNLRTTGNSVTVTVDIGFAIDSCSCI